MTAPPAAAASAAVVVYDVRDGIASVTMQRPQCHNAQNSKMTCAIAARIAAQPRLALALVKQSLNHVEDLRGKRAVMDSAFGWHHFAHAHNQLVTGHKLAGLDAKAMAAANRSS